MALMKCPRCGSENIMPNLRIRDNQGFGISFRAEVEGDPGALFFKKTRKETLRATVCGECGNVGLSVENPKRLWEIYSQRENS